MAAAGTSAPGRSVLGNFAWSSLYVILGRGIRFAAIAYCVRMLGAEGWGQVVSTFVIVAFLNFPMDQGLGLVPALYRVGDASLDGAFLRKITVYRTCMALGLIAGIQAWQGWSHSLNPLIPLFALALLPRAWNLDWWFQRQHLYRLAMGIAAAKALLFAGGIALALNAGAGPKAVVAVELGTEFAGAALGYALYRIHRLPAVPGDAVASGLRYRLLLRLGMPLLLIGILNTVHQSIDVVFLKHMCGYGVVGEYDVGYKIGYFLFFLGGTIVQIIRPRLAGMRESGRSAEIGGVLKSISGLLSCLGAAFMIFSFYFSEWAVSFIFGQRTDLSRFVFQWAPLWVASAFMTILCADTLLSLGMKSRYIQGALLCAAVNVLGNYFLIEAFGGYGSLFATVGAELAFLGFSLWALPADIRGRLSGTFMAQASAYACLIAIFLATRRDASGLTGLGLSLVCYGFLLGLRKPFAKSALAALRAG
ncbi:MAG TPA: oligosaccharide flippase family protein [Fibrobacteria bacterium]|nr:oligosaccharide flippase family protein [Fibrobacteria bacterium]